MSVFNPGQILFIQSTENYFYISVMRSMQQHPVVNDVNRYEINTCCDMCVDVCGEEMYSAEITFARGGNGSIWDLNIEFDEVRPAYDFEKKLLLDRLVRKFKSYNTKWMHSFTDSTYDDIRDWLCWEFEVDLDALADNINAGDNNPLVDTIYEITNYIWDALCKETGNYQACTDYKAPEMVNKQEFIEKAIGYFTPILKTYCSEECVKELIDGFVNSMEE